MKKIIATSIVIALLSPIFPSYAQSDSSNRRTSEQSNNNLLACTTRSNDKNRRLSGWQELIGRPRGEAERRAFEIGAEFIVSGNQATITTKDGNIITLAIDESEGVIRAVCRSRSGDD